MARRRFFVEQIRNQRASIEGDEAHHLVRVLRVERGQQFEISDNESVYLAEVVEAHKGRVLFEVIQKVPNTLHVASITLLLALVKFDHFEWALEKGTETGVSRFIPVVAERSERGLERAVPKRIERWRRILQEASQQSRRDAVPAIELPRPFRDALAFPSAHRYLLDENSETPPILACVAPVHKQPEGALLVGPEGGWTDRERDRAMAAGWRPVSLGPQILRAETAAIVGAAIVFNSFWAALSRPEDLVLRRGDAE